MLDHIYISNVNVGHTKGFLSWLMGVLFSLNKEDKQKFLRDHNFHEKAFVYHISEQGQFVNYTKSMKIEYKKS